MSVEIGGKLGSLSQCLHLSVKRKNKHVLKGSFIIQNNLGIKSALPLHILKYNQEITYISCMEL